MSESIVEVSTFTGSVVVPQAGEKVTAESLKIPVQALSNRTLELGNGLHGWRGVPLVPVMNEDDRFEWTMVAASGPVGWLQTNVTSTGRLLFPVPGLPARGRILAIAATLNGDIVGTGHGDPGDPWGLTGPALALYAHDATQASANFYAVTSVAPETYDRMGDYDQRHDIVRPINAAPPLDLLGENTHWYVSFQGEADDSVSAIANRLLLMSLRIQTEAL